MVFDPLASFIHADVTSDPAAGSFATGLLASLATETGAAVIVAHLAGADPGQSALASILFVVARLLHAALYIANRSSARTGGFAVGLGCCIWLFGLAIAA